MGKIIGFLWRKKIYVVVVVLVLGISGYVGWQKLYAKDSGLQYVMGMVQKGTLSTSIAGTGQVSAVNTVEIKPQNSGTVTKINVKNGDTVSKDQVLLTLDSRDAQVSVMQAQASLLSAQASYNDLVSLSGSDRYTYEHAVTSAELDLEKSKVDIQNTLATAEATKETAYANLKLAQGGLDSTLVKNAYKDSVVFLQNTSAKLRDALSDVDSILGIDNTASNDDFESLLSVLDVSRLTIAQGDYLDAKKAKTTSQFAIERLTVNSSYESIDAAFVLAEDALLKLSHLSISLAAVVDATPAIGELTQAELTQMKSESTSIRSSINSQYTSLLSQKESIEDAKDSYTSYKTAYDKAVRDFEAAKLSAQSTIHAKEVALQQAKDNLEEKIHPSTNEVMSAKAQLESARAQLVNASHSYENTIIKAPFDGIVAAISAQVGDEAGSDSAVTLITRQKIAEITLNEVDIAKVQLGQKVLLTFDALEDLSITGEVVEIDSLGTLSSGVVSYTVKISFDVQDDRIKPNMTVSATIILENKPDVLLVSSSAIKSDSDGDYVEVLVHESLEKKYIVVGSSNDTMTEIIEGLSDGDEIVVQTIDVSKTNTVTNSSVSGNSMRGSFNMGGGAPSGMMIR